MKETIPPELMSNNVNKSSLPPVIRFVRTGFSWFLSPLTRNFPVDPLICDKPGGRIRMIRTLVHAVPTKLGRSSLRVGLVSDKACRAQEYGRSEELPCWQLVAYNSTCWNAAVARFGLNVFATIVSRTTLAITKATWGLKLTKGDDILRNAGKAVLNSCWEPELRALLVVYKSHGKWNISPECISVLPKVCKRMVDKTMNIIFAIFKRKRQRYNISPASRVVRKFWNNIINTFLQLSEFFPALYTMFSDVISQKLIYPIFSRVAKIALERNARKSSNVVVSCKGLRGTRRDIVSNLIVLLRLVIVNEVHRSIESSVISLPILFRFIFPIFNILIPCLVFSAV